MKNILLKTSLFLSLAFLFASCEKEGILFDSSMNVVGFNASTFSIAENADGAIEIYLGAPSGANSTDVTIEVSAEGHDKPAVKDVDYTIASMQATLEVGVNSITISPVDNNEFTGNKTFTVSIVSNSKNYNISAQNSATVTIVDDEHPLKNWIGTYDVAAASYGSPGAWDEAWVVTTTPIEGEPYKLHLTGIAGSDVDVIASFDTDAMTISLDPGQDIGDTYGWGATVIYWGYSDFSGIDDTKILTGTIENNGTIRVDNWAHILADEDNGIWDVFNTTWTQR